MQVTADLVMVSTIYAPAAIVATAGPWLRWINASEFRQMRTRHCAWRPWQSRYFRSTKHSSVSPLSVISVNYSAMDRAQPNIWMISQARKAAWGCRSLVAHKINYDGSLENKTINSTSDRKPVVAVLSRSLGLLPIQRPRNQYKAVVLWDFVVADCGNRADR
jgi:hypothetical protein